MISIWVQPLERAMKILYWSELIIRMQSLNCTRIGFSNLNRSIGEQLHLNSDLSGPVTRFPVPPSFWNSSGLGPLMGFSNLKSGICEQLPLGHDLSGPVTRFPVPPSFWNSSGLGPLMGFSNLNSGIYEQLHPSFWN